VKSASFVTSSTATIGTNRTLVSQTLALGQGRPGHDDNHMRHSVGVMVCRLTLHPARTLPSLEQSVHSALFHSVGSGRTPRSAEARTVATAAPVSRQNINPKTVLSRTALPSAPCHPSRLRFLLSAARLFCSRFAAR
jgi:hypothetical protein